MVPARSIAEAGAMSTTAHTHTAAPRLERPRDGRVVAGVCAAIAWHLSIDPILVRIGFVAAAAAGADLGWQETAGIAVVAAGAALVAGAFFGASPWLAAPPLAMAAVVGVLAAATVAFDGPIGSRSFAPAGVTALPASYQVA